MRKNNFERLDVWKKACRLTVDLYQMLTDCREFGLKDQMTRAAVSIPSNIAEGSARNSDREFIHFLHIAKGSAAELTTQLYIAAEIGVISKCGSKSLLSRLDEISAMIQGLIETKTEKETKAN